MNRKNQNKRREFLNNVCPTVAMAFLGVSLLESCSSGEDDSDINGGGNNGGGNNGGGSDNGYTKNGNDVTINLNHSSFSKLKNDGWQNFYQEKIILLKVSSTSYRAFNGICPHKGIHTAWSYNGSSGEFVCGQHGNSYKGNCATPAANPNSNATSGSLKCFNTSLSGTSLKVTKS